MPEQLRPLKHSFVKHFDPLQAPCKGKLTLDPLSTSLAHAKPQTIIVC
jgi:hypothetical protein